MPIYLLLGSVLIFVTASFTWTGMLDSVSRRVAAHSSGALRGCLQIVPDVLLTRPDRRRRENFPRCRSPLHSVPVLVDRVGFDMRYTTNIWRHTAATV